MDEPSRPWQEAYDLFGDGMMSVAAIVRRLEPDVQHLTIVLRSKYQVPGEDIEDCRSWVNIALLIAIRDYNPEKNLSFLAFFGFVANRYVISALKSATRKSRSVLDQAISLDSPIAGDPVATIGDTIGTRLTDPGHLLVREDLPSGVTAEAVQIYLRAVCTEIEWLTYHMRCRGYSYKEIYQVALARGIKCGRPKAIDNALSRVKRKLALMPRQ